MPTSRTEIPLYRFCSATATLPAPVIALILKENSEHTAANPSSDAREPQPLSLLITITGPCETQLCSRTSEPHIQTGINI